jgi:hypothetical protein
MTRKKPHNAADEQAIADAEKERLTAEVQLGNDIREILALPAGVRFMRYIIGEGMIFSTSMTGNSWTYFNEGKRDFANSIFAKVCEVAPDKARQVIFINE